MKAMKPVSNRHCQAAVQERKQHPLKAVSVEEADLTVVPAPAGAELCIGSGRPLAPVSLEAT